MDLYVMPVENITGNDFAYPFIVYGDIAFLEVAVVKGCIDYLKEPWSRKELLFRIRKALYSLGRGKNSNESEWKLAGRSLAYGERTVVLSFPEALVFRLFLAHRDELVNREALYYTLWGRLPAGKSRVIDVHISSLRRKLKYLKDNPEYNALLPVRGYGYLFTG